MQISLPQKPKIRKVDKNRAVFEIEGCYPGYGITLGNALRRALLSSLPGSAVTSVKIKGVQHEFSTIPHVAENIIEIILNLKMLRFKLYSEEPVKVFLKSKGEKEVKAGDIQTTSNIEIINKDAHLATLTNKKAALEMEIEVSPGLGFVPSEQLKKGKLAIGTLACDAVFSPVRRVNFEVENMRVGERTDYNRLKIDIKTDGSVSPEEALSRAAKILVDQFSAFEISEEKEEEKKPEKKRKKKIKKIVKKAKKKTKKAAKTKKVKKKK